RTSAAGHPWRGDALADCPGSPTGAGSVAAGRGRSRPAATSATGRPGGVSRMPLLIALQFLTRLPVRLPGLPTAQENGRSLLWYRLVGLLVGGWLVRAWVLLRGVWPRLQAALLLAVWGWLSGGRHLDGVADSADAWVGGDGGREGTLA